MAEVGINAHVNINVATITPTIFIEVELLSLVLENSLNILPLARNVKWEPL